MSRVYWDSMLFVYSIEDHPEYAPRVEAIRIAMLERGDLLCTSVLTLAELLAGARKRHNKELEEKIRGTFDGPDLEVLPFVAATAPFFGEIRATHNVTAADAIHLACAAQAATDVFVTNDHSLAGKTIPGIQFIVGLETDLFGPRRE